MAKTKKDNYIKGREANYIALLLFLLFLPWLLILPFPTAGIVTTIMNNYGKYSVVVLIIVGVVVAIVEYKFFKRNQSEDEN